MAGVQTSCFRIRAHISASRGLTMFLNEAYSCFEFPIKPVPNFNTEIRWLFRMEDERRAKDVIPISFLRTFYLFICDDPWPRTTQKLSLSHGIFLNSLFAYGQTGLFKTSECRILIELAQHEQWIYPNCMSIPKRGDTFSYLNDCVIIGSPDIY